MAQAAGAEDVEDTEGAAVVEGEVAEVAEAVEEAVEEDVIRDNHRRVNHDLRSLACGVGLFYTITTSYYI